MVMEDISIKKTSDWLKFKKLVDLFVKKGIALWLINTCIF